MADKQGEGLGMSKEDLQIVREFVPAGDVRGDISRATERMDSLVSSRAKGGRK